MADVTWLGDEDPSVQSIEQHGYTFDKGVPTAVPDKDKAMAKFKGNAFFEVEGASEPEAKPAAPKAPKAT